MKIAVPHVTEDVQNTLRKGLAEGVFKIADIGIHRPQRQADIIKIDRRLGENAFEVITDLPELRPFTLGGSHSSVAERTCLEAAPKERDQALVVLARSERRRVGKGCDRQSRSRGTTIP